LKYVGLYYAYKLTAAY